MRYFIKKSVLNLKKNNPKLFKIFSGSVQLFIFQDDAIVDDIISVGQDELIEIEIIVEGEKWK